MRTIAAIVFLLATIFAQQSFAQQGCPTLVVSNNNDVVNGNTSSPCALIATNGGDGISLREALLAANNATGSGTITITFASALAGTTIALTQRFAPITRGQITLTGLTNNGQPDITLDATDASNQGAILFIAASQFTMTGMSIVNLPTNFNAMQIGGYGYNATGQMVASPAQICCFQITGNTFSNGTGSNSFGIYVPANDSNETIADVTIANNSFSQLFEAINIQGGGPSVSNSVIQDVVVFGNTFSQMTSAGTSAVEVSAGPTNDTIQRVQIVQNTFTGNLQGFVIDMGGASSGNLVQDVTVARNIFSGNLQALGIVAGVNSSSDNNTVSNTQIVDNVIDLTGYNGQGAATIQITDSQTGGTNDKVTGVLFVNDTIYNGSSASPPGWGVWVNSIGGVTGVSVSNTIFWGNESSPALTGMTSSQVSYSIIDQSGFGGTNNNTNVDPLFVDASGGNFELQSGSPALGAGTSAGAPAIDVDCQPRGSPPSIGAYEFEGPDICRSAPGHLATDSHDFNGDGYSDIAWRDTSTGDVAVWLMSGTSNGVSILQASDFVNVPPAANWSIVGQRDFDGDGNADLLWRNGNGDTSIWLMNGTAISQATDLGITPTAWSVAGTGDFNGDGRGDILWRNTTTGDVSIWLMNGATISQASDFANVPLASGWTVAGTGDFNGDGMTDILWRNTTTGDVAIWLMNGTAISQAADFVNVPVASGWTIGGTGDFNGDGYGDILWRNTATGDLAVWLMNGAAISQAADFANVPVASGWAIALTGDFNGDGYSDILWRNTSTGDVAVWLMNAAAILQATDFVNVPLASGWTIQGVGAD